MEPVLHTNSPALPDGAATESPVRVNNNGFREYPSLQPDRGAASTSKRLLQVATESHMIYNPESVLAVATPKIHGSNLQVHYSPATSLKYGRRSAFLTTGEAHFGAVAAGTALDLPTKMPLLYQGLQVAHPTLQAVTVYGEVYGGWYPHPDVPSAKPAQKPVQKGIWYAPTVQIVAFDVQLTLADGKTQFLGYDDARFVCELAGIPFIFAAKRGPLADVCKWAVEHAKDNALAYYNPLALPLLDGNGGEGFVVRLVAEARWEAERALAKVKNPAFSEVSTGPGKANKAGKSDKEVSPEWAAGQAVGLKFLNGNRAAAVTSKMAQSEVTHKNIAALARALMQDARADSAMTSEETAAVVPGGPGESAFTGRAFFVMREHLAGRSA